MKMQLNKLLNGCLFKIKQSWKKWLVWTSFSVLLAFFLWLFAVKYVSTVVTIVVFFVLLSGVAAYYYFFDRANFLTNKKAISFLGVIAVVGIYCCYTYNRLFPLTEGWYTLYAQRMLSGEIPYKDFHLLFTPIYTYFIAIFVLIFGPNIIVLRIVGVFILLLIAIFAYKIIKLFVDPFLAAPFTIAAIYLMQSNSTAIIYYDYIFLYNLLNYIGIYYCLKGLLSYFQDEKTNKYLSFVISGIFLCLAFLTRQSSGLINLIFAVLLIIYLAIIFKKQFPAFELIAFLIGSLISVLLTIIVLAIHGNLVECFRSCFVSAVSAKGGLLAELFRWIPSTFYPMVVIIGLVLFGGLVAMYVLAKRKADQAGKEISPWLLMSLAGVTFFAILIATTNAFYVVFHVEGLFQNITWPIIQILYFMSMMIFFSLAVYFIVLFIKKKTIETLLLLICGLAGFVFFTQFGSCTSGGASEGQGALSLPLVLICLDYSIKHLKRSQIYRIVMVSFAGLFSLAVITRVKDIAYSWWCINTNGFIEQGEKTDAEILSGIKVDKETKTYIEKMRSEFKELYQDGDTLYSFCRIPITYSLLETKPMDGIDVYVPWFDVCTQDALRKDFDLIKENKPTFIIYERIPEYPTEEHEKGFNNGNKSVQREMMEYFDESIKNGSYKVVDSFNINADDYPFPYTVDFLVINK